MRILADENVPRPNVAWLRDTGQEQLVSFSFSTKTKMTSRNMKISERQRVARQRFGQRFSACRQVWPRDATIQFRGNRRWGRCRGSLRGRPHGRHVHRPSLDRWLALTFRSVRSCSALLFGDWAARYVVVVWSGVDVLSSFLRVSIHLRGTSFARSSGTASRWPCWWGRSSGSTPTSSRGSWSCRSSRADGIGRRLGRSRNGDAARINNLLCPCFQS